MKKNQIFIILFLFLSCRPENYESVGSSSDKPAESVKTKGAKEKKPLCVFDYDLTLSSHGCPGILDDTKVCPTYEWDMEGMSPYAQMAIEGCLAIDANVGILSFSPISCHQEKVAHLIKMAPAMLNLPNKISLLENWNLEIGPFYMQWRSSKAQEINRIMKFYGLTPGVDDHMVIFWDDDAKNISDMKAKRPEISSIKVERISENNPTNGCGITKENIDQGLLMLATKKNRDKQ